MMDISEEKIFEVQHVIYGIMDKIKAWDKKGTDFAFALDNQFMIMKLCGHEGVVHDLHVKEIEALEYAVAVMNILYTQSQTDGDYNRCDRNNDGNTG